MCPKTQINLRLYKKQTGTVKKLQPISNLETFSSWSCLICIYNVFQLPPATHSKIKQIWNAYWQVKPHWPYCQFYGVNTIQPPPPRSPKHTHMQCTLLKSSLVALISFQVLFSSWMQMQKNSSKERSCVKNMGWKSWQFSLAVDTKKGKGCHLKFGSSLNETW